jgi:hypothetical protein
VTGWAGGSVPALAGPTGGFPSTTSLRYTSGGFIQTPVAIALPGQEITQSMYVNTENFSDPVMDLYFMATRSAGGDVQVGALDHPTLIVGVTARFEITRTCPANTTGVYMLLDGVNMAISPTRYGACLVEQAAAPAGVYFDGQTPGPPLSSWDAAVGLSPSTLLDAPPQTAISWEQRIEAGPSPWQIEQSERDSWTIEAGPSPWQISQG